MILVILLLIWNIHTKQNVARITFPATLIDSLLTRYSLCHAYAYRGVINCRFFYSTTKPTLHQEHYYCKSKEFTMSSKQITKTTKIKCFLRKKKKGIMIIVECMSNCLVLGRGGLKRHGKVVFGAMYADIIYSGNWKFHVLHFKFDQFVLLLTTLFFNYCSLLLFPVF